MNLKLRYWSMFFVPLIMASSCSAADHVPDNRIAAWNDTIVATYEAQSNSRVSTYVKDRVTYMDCYTFANLAAGVEVNGKTLWPADATNVRVEDFPGGVVATFQVGGVKVKTEIVPLFVGRGTKDQDGAALYSVSTSPRVPVIICCGQGEPTLIADGLATMKSSKHPFTVALKTSGDTSIQPDGNQASARFANGSGSVVVAYSTDSDKAIAISKTNATVARKQVTAYYTKLLECKIETPEKVIDSSFRSALYNLEYNWLEPYGWVECVHHWYALWHMQHTGAAEWIGQADRSRECNVTTAMNLMPNGAAPQFMPSGTTHRDFGGSNQFFAWQVRHYWNFTADRKAIEIIAPNLDKVIEETFNESDRDRDGLLAWGQQIGNQEDYVSTPFNGTSPSIEGINMLRTGAMLARALGNVKKAESYEERAQEALIRLRAQLWQSDLGRFMFYKDPLGMVRADGQYHTEIYPLIWGVLDPLDSWTSIRHLRDRMIGKGGECYCSNNFPNHVGGTWGMQAGAAQQPWAAWGLSAAGLRNETYRPLKAVSEWVMDKNHRGSWPEIEKEPTPAYFSPPAGLFIQSTVEALFGLQVNRPEGYLKVAPSFPDLWPTAMLHLPDFSASYVRDGNTFQYTVTSREALSRRLRWMLPPCRIARCLVDGRRAAFKTVPGVQGVTLSVDVPRSKSTRFVVEIKPVEYRIAVPSSAAEGDTISLKATGCIIEKIDDRCSVLSSMSLNSPTTVNATIRKGLLNPYMGFGRLGQMNFSRRTFFALCMAKGNVRFWAPIDLTILPRYECTAVGEIEATGAGGNIRLVLRNNTSTALTVKAQLNIVRHSLPFAVNVPAKSQRNYALILSNNALAMLSIGDNHATLLLPAKDEMDVTVVASRLFETNPTLGAYAKSRVVELPLNEMEMTPDTDWRMTREFYAYGHYPWAGSRPPLEALAGKTDVTVPGLPLVDFKLEDRKMLVVSHRSGRSSASVNLGSRQCNKIYLLALPFLDNHDTFATVARVDVNLADGGAISRTLRFPGDLDWWCPREVVGDFATARGPRSDRLGLLPQLTSMDWKEAKPPAFPQWEYWATSQSLTTPSSVMNVIEMDLGRVFQVKSVTLSTLGVDPALGLVAVSIETPGDQSPLEGTNLMPDAEFREPRMVFQFTDAGDLKGWRTEGEAFSVAAVPSLFSAPTLNSLAKAGETATGKAISPDFMIGASDSYLRLVFHGGTSTPSDGPGYLAIHLVESGTGEILERMTVNGSHVLRDGQMPVNRWRGRKVHLELIDHNTNTGWAWLGVQQISLVAGE